MNNLAKSPYEVVVETPAKEEDKVCPSHAMIPQPNGTDLQIRTCELEDAVKMLGFCHSLGAPKSDHAKEMIEKGLDWVDRMKTGKLPRRDTWMSFFA